MELFKTCVQNKRGTAFSFFTLISIAHLMLYYKICVQIMSGLLFNFFGYFSNTKNVSSKEKENCFLVYSDTLVI